MTVPEFINAFQVNGEIFEPVLNFEKRFFISNYGRLISHDHRKNTIAFVKGNLGSLGYIELALRQKPLLRKVRLHTLVAEHFCDGKSDQRCWVNHKDGNKLNNIYSNLEWVTPSRNVEHAVETGLMNFKGENHPNSKLTKSDVYEIRRLGRAGILQRIIADQFGISRRQVGDIILGKNWGWLKQLDSPAPTADNPIDPLSDLLVPSEPKSPK